MLCRYDPPPVETEKWWCRQDLVLKRAFLGPAMVVSGGCSQKAPLETVQPLMFSVKELANALSPAGRSSSTRVGAVPRLDCPSAGGGADAAAGPRHGGLQISTHLLLCDPRHNARVFRHTGVVCNGLYTVVECGWLLRLEVIGQAAVPIRLELRVKHPGVALPPGTQLHSRQP